MLSKINPNINKSNEKHVLGQKIIVFGQKIQEHQSQHQ